MKALAVAAALVGLAACDSTSPGPQNPDIPYYIKAPEAVVISAPPVECLRATYGTSDHQEILERLRAMGATLQEAQEAYTRQVEACRS